MVLYRWKKRTIASSFLLLLLSGGRKGGGGGVYGQEATIGNEDIAEGCINVCPNNVTEFIEAQEDQQTTDGDVTTLKILVGAWGQWIEPVAKAFSESRQDVNIELVVANMAELGPDIINEAKSKTGLFDGFITPPGVMGSIVDEQGWLDLRDYIDLEDWKDIKLGYRKYIAQYEDQILMYPLDGDLLHLFYNKEILSNFGFNAPPRTWEEYNEIAAAIHGQEYNNKTLVGSCIGRVAGLCAGAYWSNLVLSSMTQSLGPWQGHLFDTEDLQSLIGGGVMQKLLEYMEGQVKYGHPNEFESCIPLNMNSLRDGECALHYNWGNTFVTHLLGNSSLVGDKLGITKTPGSTHVLDRETMELVQCDEESCPHATYYDDIGYVNHAPYLAFGGWGCAVSNYTTSFKKKLSTEFCAYAASKKVSTGLVVPDAKTGKNGGADPFRTSHLANVDAFVEQGFGRETTVEYLDSINAGLESPNIVTDVRFPGAAAIYLSLDNAVHDHLNATRLGLIDDNDLPKSRDEVRRALEQEWMEMIDLRDAETSTKVSTLESYQRLRGVYTIDVNMNQLASGIRVYGFVLAGLTLATSIGFAIWTHIYREHRVVKASQPFFLVLICIGTFIFGSAIFPMSIDDGMASVEACSKACMSIPWLVALGWTILFSALYAKLHRVNLVFRNAASFKRLKVSEKEVMLPFAVLFTANVAILLTWTLTDPLYWERRMISETESYGTCAVDSDSVGWKVCLALLGIFNGASLILANVEAWKGRQVSTEYGESSYIGLAMASMLQVFLVGIPLMFLVQENPTATFFVNSSMAFIIPMSVLLLLFVPKVINWYRPPEANNNKSSKRFMRGRSSFTSKGGTTVSGLNISIEQIENESLKHKVQVYKDRVAELRRMLDEHGIDANGFDDDPADHSSKWLDDYDRDTSAGKKTTTDPSAAAVRNNAFLSGNTSITAGLASDVSCFTTSEMIIEEKPDDEVGGEDKNNGDEEKEQIPQA